MRASALAFEITGRRLDQSAKNDRSASRDQIEREVIDDVERAAAAMHRR